jgi:transposase
MVVNPRAARDFARASMQRSKTDTLDAAVLLEFVRRMPFQAWMPPSSEELELRTQARRLTSLTKTRTQEKNRRHATEYVGSQVVCHDIDLHVRYLDRRIIALEAKALDLIWRSPRLRKQLAHLTSVRGIGRSSAIRILGEICVLPKDMTPRQWVALAGLDPRILQSGVSLNAPARISRMGNRALRAALFLPALVATRYEPNVKAYYEKLLGRQKARLQAIVAVMRKLLHAIYGMLRTGTDFDGEKFYALGR